MKKGVFELLLTAIGGLAAGFINGMLGTGGGIILVFLLGYLMRRDPTLKKIYSTRDVFATVISAILPMSFVSAWFYIKDGSVNINDALPYILPGIAGGIAGAYLLDKINVKFLKKLFAAMVIYAGVKMMF